MLLGLSDGWPVLYNDGSAGKKDPSEKLIRQRISTLQLSGQLSVKLASLRSRSVSPDLNR
jgi:hypothetical protein